MSTLIRAALASDIGELIDLSHKTISASYRPFLGDQAVNAFLGSGAADRYVMNNVGRCSVIVRDGRVAGYAVCRDNLIDLLMIDHAFHRQWLGGELLHWVEQSLGHRYHELKLESFEANQPANAFYRKHGWQEVRRYLDSDSGVNKIVFHKAAAPTNR